MNNEVHICKVTELIKQSGFSVTEEPIIELWLDGVVSNKKLEEAFDYAKKNITITHFRNVLSELLQNTTNQIGDVRLIDYEFKPLRCQI